MNVQPIPFPPDLQPLVDREMARGGFASHGELIRQALEFWADHRDTLSALEQAFDDIADGRTRPWEDFEREFRVKNKIPAVNSFSA